MQVPWGVQTPHGGPLPRGGGGVQACSPTAVVKLLEGKRSPTAQPGLAALMGWEPEPG